MIPRRDASGDQLEILAALAIKFGHEASVATEMPHFLQAVADALAPWKKMAVHHAVQGARIELIFRNVEAAAHVALRLLAQMRAGDRFWENGLRMGIHAGPIAFTRQSLLGVDEPVGDHARKASHLRDLALWDDRKPQVHASRESAALLSIDESAHGLRCEYQGLYDWGAPYGEQAIYSVRFKNSPR
ncbi:MAG: hypothetical protein JO117_03610 [Verrucomicrobia bacterium]|nr:hypothetical protein [Verrucomicrobiota bacterium]